jgi:uncharacterized membrane protein
MMRSRTHLILIAGSLVWLTAIVLAPVLQLQPVYRFFALICHQNPLRSWTLAGAALPVCIRCISIYSGFFVALVLSTRSRPGMLKLAILATLAEVLFEWTVMDFVVLRSLTGFALGAAVAPFVRIGVDEMIGTRLRRFRNGALRNAM